MLRFLLYTVSECAHIACERICDWVFISAAQSRVILELHHTSSIEYRDHLINSDGMSRKASLVISNKSRTDQQRVGPIIGRRASKPLLSTKYQLHNKLNINSNDPLPRRPVSYRSNAFAKEVLYTIKPSQLLFTPRYTRQLPLDLPVVTYWGWTLPVVGPVP
jgi:hypothetical protein